MDISGFGIYEAGVWGPKLKTINKFSILIEVLIFGCLSDLLYIMPLHHFHPALIKFGTT